MRKIKIILLICILFMTIGLVNGFLNGNFLEDGAKLLENPWGIMSLIDLYVGFSIFSIWIFIREENVLFSIIWIILVMIFGFLTASIYIYLNINKSDGDINKLLLGNLYKK
ncbi:MAG: DUF1475 family protein [Bacillota bacterium]